MRLIGIIAVAAVSAPLLVSCNSEHSKKPWMAYDRRCEQLGFKRDTPEHTKCRLELARQETPRGSAGRTGLSPPIPRTATAKLRSMSMFFAIGFGRATQRLLGKWAERTPTPAEAPRRQEPGPRGADAYQTHPTQESNAGHGGGVPSGEDKQADKARP